VLIQRAIWARVLNPSLLRTLRMWLSTVRSEMKRRAPICLLLSPSATSSDYAVGVLRWSNRVNGYAFSLVTDDYPPFSLS
jgi:hypothetical protein